MVLESLPLMVVCFVLFPRLPGPLWGIAADSSSGVTGLSDEMTIGRIAHLGTSDEVAFRVVFSDKAPPARDLYWRGPVLWSTDGRRWQAGEIARRAPPPVVVRGRRVNYEVLLEAHGSRWLPALETIVYTDSKSRPGRARDLIATEQVKRRLRYRAESALDYSLTELSPDDRAAALALPVRAHPRARELGRSWRTQGLAPRAIVQAALAMFAAAPFTYTLTPQLLPKDPIDGFLFETKEGFCEHFAASFVVLMRAAGIPARIVTGYQGGEYNTISEYFLVRQSDAHAWAEVYLEGDGWVRVDPTAAVAPERVSLGWNSAGGGAGALPGLDRDSAVAGAWLNLRQLWDSAAYHWGRYVLGYSAERQRGLLEALGMEDVTPARLVLWLVGVMGVLLGLLALLLLRSAGREALSPAVRLYVRYCARLARIGLPRAAHEGPLEYAERVAVARRDLALEVRAIAQRFALLRYADAPDGLADLRARVRAFRPRRAPRR
jgi:transglutaminase-like putative cysteine protease